VTTCVLSTMNTVFRALCSQNPKILANTMQIGPSIDSNANVSRLSHIRVQCSTKQHPNVVVRVLSSCSVTTSELASSRFFVRLSDVHELQTPSKSSNELSTSSRTCFSTLRASGAARASDARHKRATIGRLAPKLPKKRLGLTNHNITTRKKEGTEVFRFMTQG